MAKGIKMENSYQQSLSKEFFEKCPKSVLAAIAVSFATLQMEGQQQLEETLLNEWRVLHKGGIVPQKPYRKAKPW